MMIRSVIGYQVHDYPNVPLLSFANKVIKISHGAILRINTCIVGDVVAEIDLRRWEYWCDPDCINSQIFEIIEPARDAIQIAYSVPIGVLKTPRVDFVDDRMLPPRVRFCAAYCE